MAILVTIAVVFTPVMSEAATKKRRAAADGPNPRYASIVIDADTGAILSESGADKQLHPASLVKMMTLLMLFDRLENGTMTLNQRIPISSHAANQSPSKLGLNAGSSIAVKDAIYGLVTKSANDVAVAVGEQIGGSESRFAVMMTQRAHELGMTHTQFKNASGLHNPAQYSSARDIAKLSRILIKSYPQEYKYFSTRNFRYNGAVHHNHNRLMETYQGMDGIKTGYIVPSGFNLAASAVRGNHRVIAVVFGGRSTQSRNAHVADLLDRGFAKLKAGDKGQGVIMADATPTKSTLANVPVPGRKPGSTAAPQVLAMNTAPTTMNELSGQGDIDPAVAQRFEAGMMAIAAIKNEIVPSAGAATLSDRINPSLPATPRTIAPEQISFSPVAPSSRNDEWSIQVGAYTSRVRSDQALNEAIKRLPTTLQHSARPVIVPMKAGDEWVFRARIRGLSREQAAAACKYFNNCMAISPRTF